MIFTILWVWTYLKYLSLWFSCRFIPFLSFISTLLSKTKTIVAQDMARLHTQMKQSRNHLKILKLYNIVIVCKRRGSVLLLRNRNVKVYLSVNYVFFEHTSTYSIFREHSKRFQIFREISIFT